MNREWAAVGSADFDLVVVTCGYEARASYIFSRFSGNAGRLVVLDYRCRGMHSYDHNRARFEAAGPTAWVDLTAADAWGVLTREIETASAEVDPGSRLRVMVDISSCSRSVLASLLLVLARLETVQVSLTCAYAVSSFYDPPLGELPSSVSEPVIGDLSGWSDDLSKPPCAIIGLGFEPGRALGSIDYLEVPDVRLFLPDGPDDRFRSAVLEANDLLIREVGLPPLRYDVLNPEDAYQKLASLTIGLLPNFRPIIIPLGPKVFAALSMLLALRLFPQVCVWRTSAGSGEEVEDRSASGEIVAFDFELPNPIWNV